MKKGGIKGGALGVGKGIYGLIVKPVAGKLLNKFHWQVDGLIRHHRLGDDDREGSGQHAGGYLP